MNANNIFIPIAERILPKYLSVLTCDVDLEYDKNTLKKKRGRYNHYKKDLKTPPTDNLKCRHK